MSSKDNKKENEKAKTTKALQAARERASAQPRDPAAHEQLAAAYHELARLEEAEAAYRRAIDLDATRPGLLNSLGNVLADAGRLRDAVGCYEQAIQVAGSAGDSEATCSLELARLELPRRHKFSPTRPRTPKFGMSRDGAISISPVESQW